jgi:hypothetical protein
MSKENVEIEVQLASQWHNDPPVFEVALNDEFELGYGTISEKDELGEFKSIKWSGELEEGEYTLKIYLKGKNVGKNHTIKDSNGNVIDDQLLYIKAILIDDIDLGHVATAKSKYYTDNTDKANPPKLIEGKNVMGYNGVWQLTFSVPTYMWMLENF